MLWDAHRRYFGSDDRRVLVAQAPTMAMNPTIDPQIIEDALAEDPAAASAEWLAQFRTDVEGFATLEVVEACVEFGCQERAPIDRPTYRAFCDPAGAVRTP